MSVSNSQAVAIQIFECDLDRDEAGIPPNYMLKTSGVLVAGKDMLTAVGIVPGAPEPEGWVPAVPAIAKNSCFELCGKADYEKPSRDGSRILRAKRYGELWAPERSRKIVSGRHSCQQIEELVFAFTEAPIWARTPQGAMRLAEHCDPIPTAPVAGFWRPVFTCT
jgi:hypothetical protein